MAGTCFACGSGNVRQGLPYHSASIAENRIFQNLTIAVCGDCGLGFATPELRQEDLDRYYAEVYRSEASHLIAFGSIRHHKWAIDTRSLAQLALARTWGCDLSGGKTFLDLGAGSGASFNVVRNSFPDCRLVGLDANPDALAFYRKNFLDIAVHRRPDEISDSSIDLALLSHSLEHFRPEDIAGVVRSIAGKLTPGGYTVIEVPHQDLRRTVYRDDRRDDTPHICFFTCESLTRLACDAGLEVLFADTCGPWPRKASEIAAAGVPSISRPGALAGALKPLRPLGALAKLVLATIRGRHPAYHVLGESTFAYGGDRSCLRMVARRPKA